MHAVHRLLAAATGLRNTAGSTWLPCGVLLRRRQPFAGADARRDAAGDAALSAVDPQLDHAARRFDTANNRPARQRPRFALRCLPLSGPRARDCRTALDPGRLQRRCAANILALAVVICPLGE